MARRLYKIIADARSSLCPVGFRDFVHDLRETAETRLEVFKRANLTKT